MLSRYLAVLTISPILFASFAWSENETANGKTWEDAYSQMSIQELVNVEVTTASKKAEKLSDVASAAYVLTDEDIRRSGVTTIPDALRLVPGVNVAQIDRSQWAVSIRGFDGLFSDKLLVLIDGRSVYTPLFSGVFWNENDLMLEDIERIEVIRGPGATLWGSNAVNGVINIITKSSSKTHGLLASAGGGKEENAFGALRYGDSVGNSDYRVYAKASTRDDYRLEDDAGAAHDDWDSYRLGFRTDTKLGDRDNLTVQGDSYYGEAGWNLVAPDLANFAVPRIATRYYNGQNILARWTKNISASSDFTLQAYWDRIDRNDIVIKQRRNTYDVDGQLRFSPLERHDVLVGAGYRVYHDDHDDTFVASVDPSARTLGLTTAFVQDEVTIVPTKLKLVLGTKLEANQLTGAQVLPNIRLVSTPNERNSIWASISRAVRNPGRFNKDGRLVSTVLPGQALPTVVSVNGNPNFDSEELVAYEAGYRTQILDKASLDIATFFNHYDKLASLEPLSSPFVSQTQDGIPYIDVPFSVQNKLNGRIYGGEVALDVRPFDWWRLVGSYSHFNIQIYRDTDSQDAGFEAVESQTSRNQMALRSQINLPHNVELDAALRYASDVEAFNIDSYVAVDARLGWHASQNLELAIVGQNLFNAGHLEYTSNLVNTARTEVERAFFGKLTYRF
ncbi:MAG: TonB-dependent receptor [Oligoflexia bacterium]|nr:TonB-dependent receptor [Oligoflexia bacterium]